MDGTGTDRKTANGVLFSYSFFLGFCTDLIKCIFCRYGVGLLPAACLFALTDEPAIIPPAKSYMNRRHAFDCRTDLTNKILSNLQ